MNDSPQMAPTFLNIDIFKDDDQTPEALIISNARIIVTYAAPSIEQILYRIADNRLNDFRVHKTEGLAMTALRNVRRVYKITIDGYPNDGHIFYGKIREPKTNRLIASITGDSPGEVLRTLADNLTMAEAAEATAAVAPTLSEIEAKK